MSTNWYIEFLQRLREFRTNCVDAMRDTDLSDTKLNVQPISRSIEAMERHWKKQFPQHALPHKQDIDRHLRFGLCTDVLDLMTKDIYDAEVNALSVLADTNASQTNSRSVSGSELTNRPRAGFFFLHMGI